MTTLVVLLAGCAATPLASPATSEPSPPGVGGASACSGARLLGPDGTRIDLTGTWEGFSAVWYVMQSGSCVTMEGLSRSGDEFDGESFRFVFSGDLDPDFSMPGRWTWTWACNGPACPVLGETKDIELRVGFAENGEPTIEVPSSAVFGREDRFLVTLARISLSTEFPR